LAKPFELLARSSRSFSVLASSRADCSSFIPLVEIALPPGQLAQAVEDLPVLAFFLLLLGLAWRSVS